MNPSILDKNNNPACRLPLIPDFLGAPPAIKRVQPAERVDSFEAISMDFYSGRTRLNYSLCYNYKLN